MPWLLIGHYDHFGNLVITESHSIEDGDEKTITDLVAARANDSMAWADTFDVDSHSDAVQRAYERYVRHDEGTSLFDEAKGFTPDTR